MADLRMARVTRVHPKAHAVDLVMLDGGLQRHPMVKVLCDMAGAAFGRFDLPEPGDPGEPYGITETDRDVYAAVGTLGGRLPVVVGFVPPEVCQLMFDEKNRRVDRHASDVYFTITDSGDSEFYHPSGTYLRIAESADHEDLTGKDFDKQWKIERNTARAPHVKLVVRSGGATKATVHITPAGAVTVESVGNASLKAPQITLDTAKVVVTGAVEAAGDVKAGTVSLQGHVHTNVQGGSAQSGPPQA